MAKRGRPRKRGGLAHSQVTPRVPMHAVCDRKKVAHSSGKSIDLQIGIVEGVDNLPRSADAQIRRKVMMPIELWGDEEGDLVENQVTTESSRGSPYMSALKRVPEDSEPQLNPLAGNRDLNKGTPLSRKSRRDEHIIITTEAVKEELEKKTIGKQDDPVLPNLQNLRAQGKEKHLEEEWQQ
ncbi:hypothetical protein Dimus_030591, partial [Dionaea muscipula]